MSKKSKFTFVGGDLRQFYMMKELTAKGYEIATYGTPLPEVPAGVTVCNSLQEAIDFSDVIVGPVPFSKTRFTINASVQAANLEIEPFLTSLTPSHTLFAGAILPSVKMYCDEHHIQYVDFMSMDKVAILNSIATAEGTIAEAIQRSPINLSGSPCLVLGYGKCGSILAAKLKGLNAKVCVAARKSSVLAEAECAGFQTLPFDCIKDSLSEFLFIFNTIPAKFFDESLLKEVSKDAILLDISSNPGCVDQEAAKKLGVNSALCLGLPGKYAPKTSGQILADALLNGLKPQV